MLPWQAVAAAPAVTLSNYRPDRVRRAGQGPDDGVTYVPGRWRRIAQLRVDAGEVNMTRPDNLHDPLRDERYLLLTTFRRNGEPMPTPVWFVMDGPRILVWTGAGTGKVRRIRANPAVTVAACTARGRPRGETIAGHATILDPPPAGAERMFVGRYGLQYRAMRGYGRLRGKLARRPPARSVLLAITLDRPGRD